MNNEGDVDGREEGDGDDDAAAIPDSGSGGVGDDFGAQTPPMDDDDVGGDDNADKLQPAVADEGDGDDDLGYINDGNDDGITQSPPGDNDGITQSPPNDGFTQSPPGDSFTQSPPPANYDQAEDEERAEDKDGERPEEEEEEVVADGTDVGNGWVAYKDENAGQVYYYNAETGETQWDRPNVDDNDDDDDVETNDAPPPGARSPVSDELLDTKQQQNNEAHDVSEKGEATSPAAFDGSGDSPNKKDQEQWPEDKIQGGSSPMLADEEEKETEEKKKEDTAATSEQFLQQPDAVMEPNVFDQINVLVRELGHQVAGPKAMQSLMNGYGGDTAVCGLMGLWLAELKSMDGRGGAGASSAVGVVGKKKVTLNVRNVTSNEGTTNNGFQEGADSARDVAEEVVNRLAKERFTKDGGDAIMKLSKKEATFIDNMIKSDRWRKLLIDLSATNKDSKLFMYCLQSISNLGHHRDIANRINQSDYFGVFNSMLQSELTIAAKIAVDGYTKEVVDSIDTTKGPMGSLIADLRRTCTSTSYTYLYAMEVLGELLSKSKKRLLTTNNGDAKCKHPESLKRAIRKWERLREELEDEMLKPMKAGTTFQRKRRIDVCLTMSDLFQRKRRRVDPRVAATRDDATYNGVSNNSSDENLNMLDTALSQLLTKNSLGVQIDKEMADSMLKYAYGGSTDRIGDLLTKHPMAVTALLCNLFGSTKRIRQLETRLKCARLVALAVTASERLARRSSSSDDGRAEEFTESDEDTLCQVILKASQLCEQLENMVSFTVLDDVTNATEGSSGRQLSSMCIQHTVVAQGVLIWAKELASGTDFVSTASYPTISPCILSLARLICRYHPLTRPAVLEIALIFMSHSNREISHRKMQSIKEQCLRLMLWLSTQGLSLTVLSAVLNKLQGSSSEMDSALVRYFFTGILDIVQPPFSMAFVRALGVLMLNRSCMDALQSKHFEASKQELIVQLISQFQAAGNCQKVRDEEDLSLLSTLKSTYYA